MDKRVVIGGAIAVVVLLLGIGMASAYNGHVSREEAVTTQSSQVDVAYQTYFRLIPQLQDVVETYLENETEVLRDLTALRSGQAAAESGDLNDKDVYAEQVRQFRITLENYPQLTSQGLWRDLATQITNSENKIGAEKVRYNDYVQDYNTGIRTCCLKSLMAKLGGFDRAELIGYDGTRPNTESFPGS